MELTIYWTDFSKKELLNIFNYHNKKVSSQVAKKLVNGIYNESLKLKKQPEIGQIEDLLKSRKQDFRYLIFKNYKIIYWRNTEKNWIEIVDVFDTRQNPPKMKKSHGKLQ